MNMQEKVVQNALQSNGDLDWASEYGEPGYTAGENGILFDNWNELRKSHPLFMRWLEENYSIEWCDEWYIDYEHGAKAWRTCADSYSWICQIKFCDGYVLTPDDDIDEWIDECKNDEISVLPDWITPYDLAERGFNIFNGIYESGFNPGQNDNPKDVIEAIESTYGSLAYDVVFRIESTGQFDVHFQAFIRETED